MSLQLFGNDITRFVHSHEIAVLATVNEDGQPFSSTIYYAPFGKDAVCFLTRSETKKFDNLRENDRAAMTITDSKEPVAVNLTGTARVASEPKDHDDIMQKILKVANSKHTNNPPVLQLKAGTFTCYIFEPKHATLTDYTSAENKMSVEENDYS